jgi:hypothetical protein
MEIALDFSFKLNAIKSQLSNCALLFLEFLCTTFSLLCICVTVRVRNGGYREVIFPPIQTPKHSTIYLQQPSNKADLPSPKTATDF